METYGAYRADVARIRETTADTKACHYVVRCGFVHRLIVLQSCKCIELDMLLLSDICQRQMDSVLQSLTTFQAGLLGVEQEMLPIYKLTERLRETQKNIDLSVAELRRVSDNFVAAQQLAPKLVGGFKFDQDEYVQAMKKLLDAIAFLSNHRMYEGATKALEQARELLGQARKKCKADFLSAVSTITKVNTQEGGRVAWSSPLPRDAAKVMQLLDCLLSSNIEQNDLLSEYGKRRFQVAQACIRGDAASLAAQPDQVPSTDQLAIQLANLEATIRAEKMVAECVFSGEVMCHAAFRHAVLPILESSKTDIETSIQHSAGSKQGIDPFKLLEMHELLSLRLREVESIVQPPLLLRDQSGTGCHDPWILSKLLAAIVASVALATKQRLFEVLIEQSEGNSLVNRPLAKDGNVHPISSYIVNYIRRMCEHAKSLRTLLDKGSNESPQSFTETAVMQLVETLQAKAAAFRGREDLRQVFLINNYEYIASSLPPCEDKDLEAHLKAVVKPRMVELREKAISQFVLVSYKTFAMFLCDPKEKLETVKGSNLLTLESGRLIKQKFSRFNTQIEDIHQNQRQFVVPAPQIRQQLLQAAFEGIVPQYQKFYETYTAIRFSKKNTSKYVKHTPQAVEQQLKELLVGEVLQDGEQ